MTIRLRDDLTYILLKKISEPTGNQDASDLKKSAEEYVEQEVSEADFLGHLDYLDQRGYINAEFRGDGSERLEVLPPPTALQEAELTDKGQQLLHKMETNPRQSLHQRKSVVPIDSKDMPFLEKVMVHGQLDDIFDARDITEIVYRTMRDLMTTEASDRVEAELHKEALPTDEKVLQLEIAELWRDTNPVVGFLSRVRPPWHGPAPFIIDSDLFAFRVEQEGGGLPSGVKPETAIKAVFSATKDELSEERIREIADFLPDRIRQLWEEA